MACAPSWARWVEGRCMLALKRIFLLLMIPVVPAILTVASYRAAEFVLARTHRFIAPETIRFVTIVEFCVFVFIAALDAKARWAVRPTK